MSSEIDGTSSGEARIIGVVVNPTKIAAAALRRAIETVSGEISEAVTTRWYETTAEDPGTGMVRDAVADGCDLVIAAGGDGTVRAVAEALVGTGVPLGIVPAGTGNLLARNLAMNTGDSHAALMVALTGSPRAIDVGRVDVLRDDESVDRRCFLVMAGIGIDARMIDATDPVLKKRVGWLAYVSATLRVMRVRKTLSMTMSLDGARAHRVRCHTIMVGNCGTLQGDILLMPDASVDDGNFEVLVLRPTSILGWLQIVVKIFWENGVLRRASLGPRVLGLAHEVRAMSYRTTRDIRLRSDTPHRLEIDGDVIGQALALHAWVEHGDLTVIVPSRVAEAST
ncbi:diacylglycerol kinase family protein [Microbacterium sp.]|uniref:diacylglycerol/lipid kinase family protein n=1 Tax=Microbacterium sp. TaxID=51671 RepID=UPI0028986B20|nr:diacylglycerol kinase family protein [Microbacterium sp.]